MKTIASNGVEIKTGDTILVRNTFNETWKYTFFSHKEANYYVTSGFRYFYCIPYSGNEHFVGTKKDFSIPKNSSLVYAQKQEQWINKHNIKVGDRVRITRKAESGENGWETCWTPGMDNTIKKIGYITMIDNNKVDNVGIRVHVDGHNEYWYPYHILEKVKESLEFKFGAKVKASNTMDDCHDNKIGILIDQDKDDPKYKYRVAFPINDNTEGNTAWFSKIEYLE